jgi:uncharacterized OsmC-like protein
LKITLLADDSLRLEDAPGPLTIEAETAEFGYSPFHMLGSALGSCIYALLQSWAAHARIAADKLVVEVRWTFAEKPHRVGRYEVALEWPGLPEARRAAAARAAALCAVHATLTHSPDIAVEVRA